MHTPMPPPPKTSGLAVAGMVTGILSFLGLFFLASAAIVCGHMAKGRIKKSGGTLGGRGMATAALVLGYGFITLLIFLIIALPTMGTVGGKLASIRSDVTMSFVITAVSQYRSEYNRFPMEQPEGAADARDDVKPFQTDGKGGANSVINILMADTGDAEPNLNARKIRFVDLPMAKNNRFGIVTSSGSVGDGADLKLVDLWGQPYWMQFDTNKDNRIANPDATNTDPSISSRAAEFITAPVIMFSSGPDKMPHTRDDIVSWR
jgi:uncharacterized membrane protein